MPDDLRTTLNAIAEDMAVHKYPKTTPTPCANSCFADGATHRVGLVPVLSIMDGAVAGDTVQEICLECGQWFKRRMFVVKSQPNRIS